MKKRILITAIVACLISFIALTLLANEVRCVFVFASNYERIGKGVYVAPDLTADEKRLAQECISKAKERVAGLFGSFNAKQTVIIGKDPERLKKFGLKNRTGITNKIIIGTYIVIGPDGLNTDVIAHEFCHSELTYRLGWKQSVKLPKWFDDGLATQVDDRPQYSEKEWVRRTNNGRSLPPLSKLETYSQFYVPDIKQRVLNYTIAKHELKRWLDIVGQKGLLRFIDEIKRDEDFYSTYKTIEMNRGNT